MKRKTKLPQKLYLIAFLILLVSVLPRTNLTEASSSETTFYVDPSSVIDSNLTPGTTFIVSVNVSNAVDLYGWQVLMNWTPLLINVTEIIWGDFLAGQPDGTFTSKRIENDDGWLLVAETTIGEYSGVDGDGWLFSAKFLVGDIGETPLQINHSMTYYMNRFKEKIHPIKLDGYFSNIEEQEPPVAFFTYSPAEPTADEVVTFNASGSYDPDGYIVSYEWDFGDGTSGTGEIVNHTYTAAGTYTVILNVTDNDGLIGTTSAEITVTSPLVHDVAILDVTTNVTEVMRGEPVEISVVVENQGDFDETFDVAAYYDSVLIDSSEVTLAAGDSITLSFIWDTSNVAEGSYTISAEASAVPEETDLTDNTFTDGTVTITAPTETLVYIEPSITSANPDESFLVNVSITNVVDLYSYEVKVGFDGDVLKVESVEEGPFLKEGAPEGTYFVAKIYRTYVHVAGLILGDYPGVSGSGTLFTINFTVIDTGDSALHLYDTILLNSVLEEISHTTKDGYFYTTYPKAVFTYTPHPSEYPGRPIVGETVTFNATASYDPDGGAIVSYEWDFGDGASIVEDDPIATHVYEEPGYYLVNLTITDDDGEKDIETILILIQLHDVAILNVTAAPTEVFVGETVEINVTVLNEGSVFETFNVTVYYNTTPIETQLVKYLSVGVNVTLTFEWNTTDVSAGTYVIWANATLVDPLTLEPRPGEEADPEDNTFIDGTVTVSELPEPDFLIEASPSYLKIIQGSQNTSVIIITSINNFADPVYLTVSDVPSGIEVVLDPEQVTPPPNGTEVSILTITVDVAAPVGRFTITVTGTSGTIEHSVDIVLEVIELPPPPDFALEVFPDQVLVPPGGYNVTIITVISINGFSQSVDLSISGLPPEVLAVFDPEQVTPPPDASARSTLTLYANLTATPGTFTLTVTGTSNGISHSVEITLIILEIPLEDVTPPEITINEPVSRDYLRSEAITFDFSVVDLGSGIASVSATLDGISVEKGETIELFTLSLGEHTFTVTATDNVGNLAVQTVKFNVIATIDSLINLVEKFYNLGYIDDEGVKESLLDQLYAAKKKLEAGQVKVAKNILNAFTLFVEAQFGKHITVEAATVLLEDAQYVMDSLQTEKSSSSPKMASYGHVSPKWIATITRSVKSITPSSFKSAFPL